MNPLVSFYRDQQPIEMRKSIDGLLFVIKSDLFPDVRVGGLFFLNNSRDRIKLLHCDADGIAI